jgi:hypothetical protein
MSSYSSNGPFVDSDDDADFEQDLQMLQGLAPDAPIDLLEIILEQNWNPEQPNESILSAIKNREIKPYVLPWPAAVFELQTRLKLPPPQIIVALRRQWNPQNPQESIEQTYRQLSR